MIEFNHFFEPLIAKLSLVIILFIGSFFEMLWIKHSTSLKKIWGGTLILFFGNLLLIFVAFFFQRRFPINPKVFLGCILVILILVRFIIYRLIKNLTRESLFLSFKRALISILFHSLIGYYFFSKMSDIIPTQKNLEYAIEIKNNELLETMFFISFRKDFNSTLLLKTAIKNENEFAVKKIIEYGADPNECYPLEFVKKSILWYVLKWKIDNSTTNKWDCFLLDSKAPNIIVRLNNEELEYCKYRGFNLNWFPEIIHTAIKYESIKYGHYSNYRKLTKKESSLLIVEIQLLLDKGANLNFDCPLFTLLDSDYESAELFEFMIEKGVNINSHLYKIIGDRWDNEGNLKEITNITPLMLAILNNRKEYIDILLKNKNLDKNILDSSGLKALDYAIKSNAEGRIIKMLR